MIEAQSLTVYRGTRPVCRSIDLAVGRGVCLGIIGPNGSGKTSLLAGLRGLLPIDGEVRLDGLSLGDLSRREIARRVAVVPQRMEFTFPYTVEQMVLFGRAPHLKPWRAFRDDDRLRVRRLLDRLGLGDLSGVPVDAISGGERRKVFVARALAQETGIVFLDEPTAGLDPAVQEDLLALLAELRERDGKTLVVVLHDVRLAVRLCDHVLALRDGRTCFAGPPDEVVNPASLESLFDVAWHEYRATDGRSVLLSRGRDAAVEGGGPCSDD